MTFEEWWNEFGSGLPPHANEDREMHMRRVAKLAVEAEREACAMVCEAQGYKWESGFATNTACAEAIRLRSNAGNHGPA